MLKKIIDKLNIDTLTPLVIGCSAGPDSMALLHYIKNNTTNKIICAHINHNLRKESIEEENYLKTYCQDNNIIFEKIKIDIDKKSNIENQAREKRYSFYNEILKKYNTKYLFLAHHGDDLIETVLMKIERGSNIKGYAGIKEISTPNSYHNYYIIRPFLSLTKKDLEEYNKKNNIKYYIDKSNYDEKYTRNRYRKNILPLLKKENINIHKQFLKYSKTLLEYNDYVNYETNNYLNNVYHNNFIDLDEFKSIHPFMQKKILYKILNDTYKNVPNIIKEQHITNILEMIKNIRPNIKINLPHNIIMSKEYNKLYIEKSKNKTKDYKIEFKDKFTINNINISKIDNIKTDGNDICRINSKQVKLPLYIRSKRQNDKIELKGLNKHKKLKEIFIENKIPKSLRETYPILVDSNDSIIWIPNIKKSKFNASKEEFYDIILKYCEKEENNE